VARLRTFTEYLNRTVNYTEPIFVVVIMALASTTPVVGLAEAALRRGWPRPGDPCGVWLTILTIGPVLAP